MGTPSASASDDLQQRSSTVLDFDVAVGKTPGEPAGSVVRVGSENGNLVGHAQTVRREGVVHGGSGVHLRQRADRFLERLFPTATDDSSCDERRRYSSTGAAARGREPIAG